MHFQPRNKDGQRPEIVLSPQAVDSERQSNEGVMCDCLQFSLITSTLPSLLTMAHSSMGCRGTLNSWSVAKEAGQWTTHKHHDHYFPQICGFTEHNNYCPDEVQQELSWSVKSWALREVVRDQDYAYHREVLYYSCSPWDLAPRAVGSILLFAERPIMQTKQG